MYGMDLSLGRTVITLPYSLTLRVLCMMLCIPLTRIYFRVMIRQYGIEPSKQGPQYLVPTTPTLRIACEMFPEMKLLERKLGVSFFLVGCSVLV